MSIFKILLQQELNSLKLFLDHSCKSATDGDFKDFEKALTIQKTSARAVLFETNVIIERELYEIAHKAWLESPDGNENKILDLENFNIFEVKNLKMIQDLKMKQIIQLIENFFKIKVKDLDCYKEIFEIREIVNSIKHRQGFKDFRKKPLNVGIAEKHPIDIDSAYQAIDHTKYFIQSLWSKTKQN